jgi:hypothetical protein
VVVKAVLVALHPDRGRDEHVAVVEGVGDRLDGVADVVGGNREDDDARPVGRHRVLEAVHLAVDAATRQFDFVLLGFRTGLVGITRPDHHLVVGVERPPEGEPSADVAGTAE